MSADTAKICALILAGTRPGVADPMAQAAGVSHKAILPVDGIPMISRVISTLRNTPEVGRIVVCIDNADVLEEVVLPDTDIIAARPEGPSASVMAGLRELGAPLLVTTADNALLRPEWITEFLNKASPAADLSVAVAAKENVLRDVPLTKRTFIHLSDLSFSGCNLFLLRSDRSANIVKLWQHIEKNRKHPLRIAWLLGVFTLIRALCKQLSRAALYARLKKMTGAQAELVCLNDGRAAVDVDKPADLILTERLLRESRP